MADWTIVARETTDQLGEGPLWSVRHNAVFWVDILAPALNRLSLQTGKIDRWPMPQPIGWLIERSGGGFVAGLQGGIAEVELDPLTVRIVADPEPHLPGNRMNDAKADRFGRIWCGTMDMAIGADCGSLYRIGPGYDWKQIDTLYRVPNGPALSRDGDWFFHSDTVRRTVYRFPMDDAGELGPREPFITFDEGMGFPDGMTVDSDDGLWIAHWGGGRISRFHPDGRLDRSIELPARNITSIAFAGPALDRMFVTSAAMESEGQREDGGLFEIAAGATGIAPCFFAG